MKLSNNLSFTGILNGSTSWVLGATANKGTCALSGKPFEKHTTILWQPKSINKYKGRVVILEEYLKINEIPEYQERAKEIGLETNLAELNKTYFHCSNK